MEKSIERHRKKNIGRIPKNLDELRSCLENENWKQFLKMDEADSFLIQFVIKNNATKAVIFIDKTLSDSITNVINKKLIVF